MKVKPASFNPITQNLHKAVFFMDRAADQVLREKLNLTFSQFRILLAVRKLGAITQQQAARFHSLTPAAVSRQVEILKQRGLLAVKQNSQNRRMHFLSLTFGGKKQISSAVLLLDKLFSKMYLVLSPKEKQGLEKALNKLASTINFPRHK